MKLSRICFPVGLPGFPGRREFAVKELKGTLLAELKSIGSDGPNFVILTDPAAFFPSLQTFRLDDTAQEIIQASSADELLTWLIVTVRPGKATANLLGPVVVNKMNGLAVQAVQKDLELPVAAPLMVQRDDGC